MAWGAPAGRARARRSSATADCSCRSGGESQRAIVSGGSVLPLGGGTRVIGAATSSGPRSISAPVAFRFSARMRNPASTPDATARVGSRIAPVSLCAPAGSPLAWAAISSTRRVEDVPVGAAGVPQPEADEGLNLVPRHLAKPQMRQDRGFPAAHGRGFQASSKRFGRDQHDRRTAISRGGEPVENGIVELLGMLQREDVDQTSARAHQRGNAVPLLPRLRFGHSNAQPRRIRHNKLGQAQRAMAGDHADIAARPAFRTQRAPQLPAAWGGIARDQDKPAGTIACGPDCAGDDFIVRLGFEIRRACGRLRERTDPRRRGLLLHDGSTAPACEICRRLRPKSITAPPPAPLAGARQLRIPHASAPDFEHRYRSSSLATLG
jgi:hypothetical protein